MKFSRRDLLLAGAATLVGCGPGRKRKASPHTNGALQGEATNSTVPPHYLVMVTLRGGFDSVLSVDPKDASKVAGKIHCGYTADQRIQGSQRLYGPLIGGLVRHDESLCLVHGVRSDTTAHPMGLQMLMRGARGLRPGPVAPAFAKHLAGDAPMPVLNMMAFSGELEFEAGKRPIWAGLRGEAHRAEARKIATGVEQEQLLQAADTTAVLETFLNSAQTNAQSISGQFKSELGPHLRYAFQAIQGNWAKVIQVGSRLLWFDSHSDNDRFQKERLPATFDDLATFLDLLKTTQNEHGSLFSQTTVVVFSELGRYPQLNAEKGKDHWPENTWILAGRGIKGGMTVGATDDQKLGLPIDFQSGRPKSLSDGGRPIFIDNGFATLMRLSGGDLSSRAYTADSPLNCVLS